MPGGWAGQSCRGQALRPQPGESVLSMLCHGASACSRASSVRCSAESCRMSLTRRSSSGKPIATQPTCNGAFMRHQHELVRPALHEHQAAGAAAVRRQGGRAPQRRGRGRCVPCRGRRWRCSEKSVPSSATSVAPMRSPWFSSTEPMVGRSSRQHRLAEAVVGGEHAGGLGQRLGALVEQCFQHAFADRQLVGQGAARMPVQADADGAEAGDLHQRQQAEEQRDDARAQRRVEPARWRDAAAVVMVRRPQRACTVSRCSPPPNCRF